MSEHTGGTVTYHRADYHPGEFGDPWLVWFTEDMLPVRFTAEQGEAMGLTPPEPAPLVVTCNGHSIELGDGEVAAFIWWWAHGDLTLPDLPQQNAVAIKLAHLLRDARQDPQPASDEPAAWDWKADAAQHTAQHLDDTARSIDFDALPFCTVAEVTLLDGDRLLAIKQDNEPGRNWYIGDSSEVDITKLCDVRIVYQPAPLSPGECLRGLLAGRDDADELLRHAAAAWVFHEPKSQGSRLMRVVGDAAREVRG